jgi:hypothetical protein
MEDITHHVQEEEGDMFIDVQKVIDAGELERLGAEMEKKSRTSKNLSRQAPANDLINRKDK